MAFSFAFSIEGPIAFTSIDGGLSERMQPDERDAPEKLGRHTQVLDSSRNVFRSSLMMNHRIHRQMNLAALYA
jgi:hypothetical protein